MLIELRSEHTGIIHGNIVAQIETQAVLGTKHAVTVVKEGITTADKLTSGHGTALIAVRLTLACLIGLGSGTGTGDITGKREIFKKDIGLLITLFQTNKLLSLILIIVWNA